MTENKSMPWWFWLYQLYKWPVFLPLMLINSIVCAILAIFFSIVVSPRVGSFWGMVWARITCWITPVRVRVHGRENVTPGQSYVIVANHQTGFDIFLLYAHLRIDFKWVMKKELRRLPFIGYASEKVGHIFVDRSSPLAAAHSLDEAQRKLAGGSSIMIFPEGERTWEENMRPFKRGAFKLALELELPILPVTIVNSWRIKRRGFMNLVPGRAALVIHPAVNICDYAGKPVKLMEDTRNMIQSGNKMVYTK
ncbi:MAG: lysophospholipid acyltransferase family protein [Marinilabilia sp.]